MDSVVMTDLLCWMPIIILSILVQSGRYTVSPQIYTWIVTFVLPINSSIKVFWSSENRSFVFNQIFVYGTLMGVDYKSEKKI